MWNFSSSESPTEHVHTAPDRWQANEQVDFALIRAEVTQIVGENLVEFHFR